MNLTVIFFINYVEQKKEIFLKRKLNLKMKKVVVILN